MPLAVVIVVQLSFLAFISREIHGTAKGTRKSNILSHQPVVCTIRDSTGRRRRRRHRARRCGSSRRRPGNSHAVVVANDKTRAIRLHGRVPGDKVRLGESAEFIHDQIAVVSIRSLIPCRAGRDDARLHGGGKNGRRRRHGVCSPVPDAVVVSRLHSRAVCSDGGIPRDELVLGQVAERGDDAGAGIVLHYQFSVPDATRRAHALYP